MCCVWWLSYRNSWLACSIAWEDILFAKRPSLIRYVVHPSEYIHSTIVLYTNQYYHSSNKTKHMFEPHIHYCHIHLTWTSMHYERKIHVLIIGKQNFHSKNLMCFNFVEVWALWSFFTPKFSKFMVWYIIVIFV